MTRFLLTLLSLLTLVGVSFGYEQQLEMQQYVMANGLEVILVRDASAPTVAVDIWYRVGSANDPAARSGFAHLFEHMMFEGSPNVAAGEMDELLEAIGGSSNAYIIADVTAYFQTLPSHYLPLALWLDADRMAGLAVTQENLDNQRAIVIEELQLRYDNRPYGNALRLMYTLPMSYPPYQRSVGGSVEDVNKADLDDLKAFHRTYYVPNNATLVVAGDIDFDAARALIDDFFGPIPIGDDPPALPEYVPVEQTEAEIVTVEDPYINIPAGLVAYEAPPLVSPDYPALALLDYVLSTGDSSRMSKRLMDTGLALQANSFLLDNRGPSLFGLILLPNTANGVTVEEIEAIAYEEMQRILDEGVPQAELDKAIAQIKSGQIVGLETALGVAESVQSANYYHGDPTAVYSSINRYASVTSEDIQRVMREYLQEKDRHVIYVVTSDAEPPEPVVPYAAEESGDETPDYRYVLEQTEAPAPLEVNAFTLPPISETTLDNGLEVVVIEQPNMPIISLDVYMAGGGSAADAELAGLAGVTGDLISRGTDSRSAQELAGAIEQVGGSLGSGGGGDSMSVGVFGLIEDTELAFDLLADMVFNATFPQEEVDREVSERIGALEANLANPGFVAGRTFGRLLYAGHPYGNASTEESLSAITRDDIVAFYETQRQPDNAVLIIAGAISAEEGLALAEARFGDWQGSGDAVAYPPLPEHSGQRIVLVDRPGSTQANFLLGNLAIKGDSLDYFPARALNEVLGGGFTSRLVQNIREEKGYTYSIGSGFTYPADIGRFVVSSAVRNEVVADALREVFIEIERIQTEPLTDDELNDAREGIIGRFALTLESYQDFVEAVASYKTRGVELERLSEWLGLMQAVTKEDVLQAANDYLHPEDFIIVVVGDASVIQEQLETLGEVTLMEAE